MATVTELSDPYANFMLNPLPPTAADVCSNCLTFTEGFGTCYACGHHARFADAVLPISYSVAFGQLHTALRQYKRGHERAQRQFQPQLAAVLWRFIAAHDQCLAHRVRTDGFDLVSTVPSGSRQRDEQHPLRRLVGELIAPTRMRYQRLLRRSGTPVPERTVDPGKYNPTSNLHGESILLIDDTWASGANVQSAAGALKTAGAGAVGVIVIGRHVKEDYGDNAARLKALPRPFEWERCALHQ
jgi:predicted amidophosphoribosyltransferase